MEKLAFLAKKFAKTSSSRVAVEGSNDGLTLPGLAIAGDRVPLRDLAVMKGVASREDFGWVLDSSQVQLMNQAWTKGIDRLGNQCSKELGISAEESGSDADSSQSLTSEAKLSKIVLQESDASSAWELPLDEVSPGTFAVLFVCPPGEEYEGGELQVTPSDAEMPSMRFSLGSKEEAVNYSTFYCAFLTGNGTASIAPLVSGMRALFMYELKLTDGENMAALSGCEGPKGKEWVTAEIAKLLAEMVETTFAKGKAVFVPLSGKYCRFDLCDKGMSALNPEDQAMVGGVGMVAQKHRAAGINISGVLCCVQMPKTHSPGFRPLYKAYYWTTVEGKAFQGAKPAVELEQGMVIPWDGNQTAWLLALWSENHELEVAAASQPFKAVVLIDQALTSKKTEGLERILSIWTREESSNRFLGTLSNADALIMLLENISRVAKEIPAEKDQIKNIFSTLVARLLPDSLVKDTSGRNDDLVASRMGEELIAANRFIVDCARAIDPSLAASAIHDLIKPLPVGFIHFAVSLAAHAVGSMPNCEETMFHDLIRVVYEKWEQALKHYRNMSALPGRWDTMIKAMLLMDKINISRPQLAVQAIVEGSSPQDINQFQMELRKNLPKQLPLWWTEFLALMRDKLRAPMTRKRPALAITYESTAMVAYSKRSFTSSGTRYRECDTSTPHHRV